MSDKPQFSTSLINRIRVDISTHRINTYADVARTLQIPHLCGEGGIFKSIKPTDRITVGAFNALATMLPAQLQIHEAREQEKRGVGFHGDHLIDSYGWIPPASELQKCKLFPHQMRAAKDAAYELFINNRRGILLEAAAGDGKTFIYGQLIRWLVDKGWFKDCYSPYPCVIVTKSAQETLVKQTERVMEKHFGLLVPRQVFVLSYDALRSGEGLSRLIQKKRVHENGELVWKYNWIPLINPKLLIGDEIQACRRQDAIQTKVFTSFRDLPSPMCDNVRVICSSATPFTRISEAECVATNCGVEI